MGNSMARSCTSITGLDPDEFERYKKEHAEQLAKITELEEELKKTKELEAAHDSAKGLVATLQAELEEKKSALSSEREQNQAEITRIERELAQKQELEQASAEKDAQIAAIQAELDAKRSRLAEQEQAEAAQIALLEKHLAEKKELEAQHQALLAVHETKTKELTEQTRLHERRASDLEKLLAEKEQHIKEKDRVVREKTNSLVMTEQQAADLRFQLQVEQETRERIEAELSQMQEELKSSKDSLAAPVARKIFGVPLDQVPTLKVTQYPAAIPQILLDLRAYIEQNKILEKKGVFRIPPSKKQLESARAEIESGKFPHIQDHNVAPALITLWFRELPELLLSNVKIKDVKGAKTNDKAWKIIKKMPEPQHSAFLWLLDLCVDTAKLSAYNSMDVDGLAKVWAPNLYKADIHLNITAEESMQVLANAKLWAVFLRQVISYRLDNPIS